MKISREVKTAILVMCSIALSIWGYGFLKGKDIFTNYQTFYAIYENVEGLTPSAPVTINGLTVGKVVAIKFLDNDGKLVVEINVKNDFPISKSSQIAIYEPGVIGGRQISILTDYKNTTFASSGDTLQGVIKNGLMSSVADNLGPLQEKIEHTIISVDTLFSDLHTILDQPTKNNIKHTIKELNKTLTEFAEISKDVNKVIKNNQDKINSIMTNADVIASNFSKISDSLSKIKINETIKKMNNMLVSVDDIMSDLQEGKGSMGKLLKDEEMYNSLTGASNELKLLLADLRNNPKRYAHFSLFGKKATPYVAPKEEEKEEKDQK